MLVNGERWWQLLTVFNLTRNSSSVFLSSVRPVQLVDSLNTQVAPIPNILYPDKLHAGCLVHVVAREDLNI